MSEEKGRPYNLQEDERKRNFVTLCSEIEEAQLMLSRTYSSAAEAISNKQEVEANEKIMDNSLMAIDMLSDYFILELDKFVKESI